MNKHRNTKKTFEIQLREASDRTPQKRTSIAAVICAIRRFSVWMQRLSGLVSHRRRVRRKLSLLEMQQLGEKRFVAVVRVGKQQFLIGGAATSVSLLAELTPENTRRVSSRTFGKESA